MRRSLPTFLTTLFLLIQGCVQTRAHESARAGRDHPLVGLSAPAFRRIVDQIPPSGKTPASFFAFGFWASWCEGCDRALSELSALSANKGQRVAAVGISIDESRSSFEAACARSSHGLPLLWDKGQRLAAAYRLSQLPTTFIIDQNGTIRAVLEGNDALVDDTTQLSLRATGTQSFRRNVAESSTNR